MRPKRIPQEKLAEYSKVIKRTYQRVESGEVEPRAFALNNLGNILEFDFVNETLKMKPLGWRSYIPVLV